MEKKTAEARMSGSLSSADMVEVQGAGRKSKYREESKRTGSSSQQWKRVLGEEMKCLGLCFKRIPSAAMWTRGRGQRRGPLRRALTAGR